MTISITANGVPVMPDLAPSTHTPEACALYVAVAEVLFARAADDLPTRLTVSVSSGRMDSLIPAGSVITMATDSEVITEDSPHFRDVLVEGVRTNFEAKAAATGRIEIIVPGA